MYQFSPADFEGKIDSLYRLVLVAARRASQINKSEGRSFGLARTKKPTVLALDEVLQGKLTYRTAEENEEDLIE